MGIFQQFVHMWTILNVQYVPKYYKAAYSSALWTAIAFYHAMQVHSALPFFALCKCTVYRNNIALNDHIREKICLSDT